MWCLVAALLVAGTACTSDGNKGATAGASGDEKAVTVVAIGGSATAGEGVSDRLHKAWPYRMFRDALPRSSVFVNAAVEGATAASAETAQVPIVQELHPDIVAIWLGADDLVAHVPIADFARALSRVITAVQAAGTDRVLVGNLPSAYGRDVGSYNSAIQHVVRETGSELVELDREHVTVDPVSGAALRLDDASHAVVAGAFGRKISAG
jgi:lysophospholipase L1-like esterase